MTAPASARRYRTFATHLGVTMLLSGVVTGAGLGISAAVLDGSHHHAHDAWVATAATNRFYTEVASGALTGRTVADTLAGDLHRVLAQAAPGTGRAVLARWQAGQEDGRTSVYSGASDVLGFDPFTDSADSGNLEPVVRDRVMAAFQGNLATVLTPQGADPGVRPGRIWPGPGVLALLYAALGTLGVLFGYGLDRSRRDDAGPLTWRADGHARGAKLLAAVLAPHLVGLALVLSVPGVAVRAATTTAGAALARRRAYRLELARARTAEAIATRERLALVHQVTDSPVGPAFLEAQRNLEALEALPHDTPAIEAAKARCREVLAALSLAPAEVSRADAEAEAAAIVARTEALLDARTAVIAGHAAARRSLG